MNKNIYPLAYTLQPNLHRQLYYLGFPPTWKSELLSIARANNPRFKDEYGLPTNSLKKMVDAWVEGIISLAPLKLSSHDERWLASCHPFSDKDIDLLCGIIQTWVTATYVSHPRASISVKQSARAFCSKISPGAMAALRGQDEVCLTREDGTVSDEAFGALPLLAVDRLLGQTVDVGGHKLRLCHCGKNQLMSEPITDPRSQHRFSYVFDLSVQTTPPRRHALLLCQMSIRRWIFDRTGDPEKRETQCMFLKDAINVHIRVSDKKYCQVPIAYDWAKRAIGWRDQDRKCYELWGYTPLQDAGHVLNFPGNLGDAYLLPYKNGMNYYVCSKIGPGVPMIDKVTLYQQLGHHLSDLIGVSPVATRMPRKKRTLPILANPGEYGSCEQFRQWVRQWTDTDKLVFELYGLWNDPIHRVLLDAVEQKVKDDFGDNKLTSCMEITVLHCEIGDMANALSDDEKSTHLQHSAKIKDSLVAATEMTGCIFVLPGADSFFKMGDPKQAIRNGFARTGRVVQFITPDESDAVPHKVKSAVHDLYRQLGLPTLLNSDKSIQYCPPCIGMHVCTQVHGIAGKGRFLPVYVTVDIAARKVRVQCDAFSRREVSYREACLEMAELFWKNDLERRCVDTSRSPVKQKLIELKNMYPTPDRGVLFTVVSDGDSRALWSGISDKELSAYAMTEDYQPEMINAGMQKAPFPVSLRDTGVRIIRIRYNQEVPDYYTERSQTTGKDVTKYASASGVFEYEKVFWSIGPKPPDRPYTDSLSHSKIDHPEELHAEKDMIELYPVLLQGGDDPCDAIYYVNELRRAPIQYNKTATLPLPLHLAKALTEYLFDI